VLQARGAVARDGLNLQIGDPGYLRDVAEGKTEPPKTS